MQFGRNNIKLRRINRNPSVFFIKGGSRTDVCLSLHLHSGQIASHSKTSVPVRGLLRGKNLIRLHKGPDDPLRNGVDGWVTVGNMFTLI